MMDDFLQFLREPIAQRSLLACVMIGFANGFVSGLVILKKSALQIGTLSCALLPGIAVAVLLFGLTRWSLLTGRWWPPCWWPGVPLRFPHIPAEPGYSPLHPAYHGLRCGLHRAGKAGPATEN